ncbi:T9SS type A sorting domain-containing protein [Chitinophaga sp. CF418]|uniref:T9SS type A sorting domain-containing protein n=1 Tax=Chitinophaga sp. CF418 TaxID=1855287 RepID=UPI0009249DD6|nr:T9SS type A sorting domain-containing protein [Chitinophaga sp. CF418]SHM83409.1 Por secretion system C-terminal sorting domain-containing protein [Chitinophaga sp. CF418]
MKRFLLFWLFLLVAKFSLAQNAVVPYDIFWEVYLTANGGTTGCDSYVSLVAEMEKGDEQVIARINANNIFTGGFGNGTFFGSFTFTTENRIKRVRVYTIKKNGNCSVAGEGTYTTADIDYGTRCPYLTYNNIFSGYGASSQMRLSFRPTTDKFVLKLDLNHKITRYAYEFNSTATVNYTDGTNETFSLKDKYYTGAYQDEQSSRGIMSWTQKGVKDIDINYKWKNESNQGWQSGTKKITINSGGQLFSTSTTAPYGNLSASDAVINISFQHVYMYITSGPEPNNTTLPVDAKIYMKTINPDIREDVMRWYYSFDNWATSQAFPENLLWKNPTYFSANDMLYGAGLANLGKTVSIRGYDVCGNQAYSAPYNLVISLSSPTFLDAKGIDVSCYGKADGGIKMKFSRLLYPGETLGLQAVDPNAGPGGTVKNFDVVIGPDSTYTTPADKPLSGGTYNLTLIGGYQGNTIYSGSAAHMATVTIFDPQPLVFSTPVPSPVKCYDGSDGAITLSGSGGTQPYKLLYKAAGETNFTTTDFTANPYTFSNLRKGDYVVSITDKNSCPAKNAAGDAEAAVTVTQPDAPLQKDNVTAVDPLANGSTDGSITVRLKGGSPFADGSYNVSWTRADGQSFTPVNTVGNNIYTTKLSNLGAGIYTLTVKDKNYDAAAPAGNGGCIYTEQVTLTDPPVLEAGITVADSISCYGMSDGSLLAVPTGGVRMATAPYYTFRWYKDVSGSWQDLNITSIKATGLSTGRYRVLVTDANNIQKYSDPKDFIEPGDLKIQFSETPVSCFGGSNGTSTATVTGGTPPFSYAWTGGATTVTATSLPTGTYTLNVIDYHSCKVSDLSFIAQPAEALQIVNAPITFPRGYGYTDGNIKVLLKGGTPKADGSYNITWKKADGTVLSNYTSTLQPGGYETLLSNIGAGDYVLTVTDANYTGTGLPSDEQACYLEQPFHVTQPDPIVTQVAEQHYVSCKGDADGALIVTTTGGMKYPAGQAPYLYEWYRLDSGTPVLLSQTTAIASGLPAGIYKVIVTDMNTVSKESDSFLLVEPELLEVKLAARAVSCNSGTDGFVKSTVTGGTLPYSWSWTNSANTQDIINVAAGNYGLLLTDGHACIVQKDTTVIEPAMPLAVADVTPVDPKAFGYTDGSIQVTLTGGTPDAAGLYNIEWIDATGKQLSTFTQTKTANGVVTLLQNIGDGSYTLKVKDAQYAISTDGSTAGCYVEATYTLHEPPLLEAVLREYRYISCVNLADGQLAAHAQGGIPFTSGLPYKYQWYSVVNGAETLIPQTDSIITGMPAGNYLVKVTDFNNITRSSPVFTLQQPAKLNINFTTAAVTCASGMDGSIVANVTGGTQPYQYEWTNGETTATIKDLTEGAYMLYVTDAHGCVALKQTDIYIPEGIKTTPVVKAPTCNNYCDGTITVGVSGGIAPYTYAWDNGSKTKDLTGLCAGKYTLTITDANNCKRIQSFTLTNPGPLVINVGADKTLCNGQTWTVNATIPDAQAKYKWSGDNGFTADKPGVTLNQTGSYNVQVTDSKGCKGADTIAIKQYQADIAAEFISPTQAFSGETVSFVNISYPKPEWVEWVLPQDKGVTVVSKADMLTELQFADTGFYTITLRAHIGDCEQVFTKSISILKGQDFPAPGGAQTPFILAFNVMPNPTDGQFTVQVKLDKQSEIRLRMINIISNQLVSDRKESAATQFNVNYQLNVTAGTYLLLLETPMGNAVRKIVINK